MYCCFSLFTVDLSVCFVGLISITLFFFFSHDVDELMFVLLYYDIISHLFSFLRVHWALSPSFSFAQHSPIHSGAYIYISFFIVIRDIVYLHVTKCTIYYVCMCVCVCYPQLTLRLAPVVWPIEIKAKTEAIDDSSVVVFVYFYLPEYCDNVETELCLCSCAWPIGTKRLAQKSKC